MNGNEYDGLDFGESCDYDVHERNERLTAENAKLRAELAEAVGLLKNIGDYACKMVKLLQEEPPAPQYAIRRWGRIVDFVAKHTTAV